MTKSVMDIQKRLDEADIDALADVLTDMFYEDFDSYEAAKSIRMLAGNAQSEHEFKLIDDTIIGIIGWSLETMLDRIKED